MKTVLALAIIPLMLLLTGCQYGVSTYNIKPVKLSDGSVVCCEVSVSNGKEIESIELLVAKQADGSYSLIFREQGVKAFAGQAIATSMPGALINSVVP